jgi:hypothetical protein
MTDTYCEGFVQTLDSIVVTVTGIEGVLLTPVLALIDLLDSLTGQIPSPQDDIRAGIESIQKGVSDATPIWEGIEEFQNALVQCSLLEEKVIDQSPISLINGLVGSVGNTVVGVVDDVVDTLSALIEMPAAVAISKINALIESLGIADLLSELDQLIACLDSMCPGYNVGTQLDIIVEKLGNVHINESGTLDLGTLYNNASLSIPQMENITVSMAGITVAAKEAAVKTASVGAQMAAAVKKLF